MALPELTQKLVELKLGDYCNNKIPAHARHQLRLSFSLLGNTATVFEEREVYPTGQMDENAYGPIPARRG